MSTTEVPKASVPAGTGDFFTYSADGAPLTQQITDADVDQVNVTIGVNALSRFKENGEIKGSIVRYKIQIQYNDGGGYSDVPLAGDSDKNGVYLGDGNFEIRGYTPDLYQETKAIVLDVNKTSDPSNFPVNIRVIRTSQEVRDFTKETVNDTLTWFNLVKIITDKTRYPNSVIFGSQV